MKEVYIDCHPFKLNSIFPDRKTYDGNLITVKKLCEGYTDNWGDDDCTKMVTSLDTCDVIIDKSIADDFKEVTNISFVRYGYYKPAYHIDPNSTTTKELLPNGNLVFHIKKKE